MQSSKWVLREDYRPGKPVRKLRFFTRSSTDIQISNTLMRATVIRTRRIGNQACNKYRQNRVVHFTPASSVAVRMNILSECDGALRHRTTNDDKCSEAK